MVMLCAVCRCSERHGDILGYQEPQQLKCTAFREVQYLDTLWCKGSIIYVYADSVVDLLNLPVATIYD